MQLIISILQIAALKHNQMFVFILKIGVTIWQFSELIY